MNQTDHDVLLCAVKCVMQRADLNEVFNTVAEAVGLGTELGSEIAIIDMKWWAIDRMDDAQRAKWGVL